MRTIYTVPQVANICRVSPSTVAAWIDDGLLSGWKLPGSRRRVTREALVAFMQEHGMPEDMLPAEDPVKDEEAEKV